MLPYLTDCSMVHWELSNLYKKVQRRMEELLHPYLPFGYSEQAFLSEWLKLVAHIQKER